MAYGAMYAYSINRDSAAFTAPINEIHNEARVYTDKDVAIPLPNSDTPYSVLFMDLRAEPLVLSVHPHEDVHGKRSKKSPTAAGNSKSKNDLQFPVT
jgi:hypothetical protein